MTRHYLRFFSGGSSVLTLFYFYKGYFFGHWEPSLGWYFLLLFLCFSFYALALAGNSRCPELLLHDVPASPPDGSNKKFEFKRKAFGWFWTTLGFFLASVALWVLAMSKYRLFANQDLATRHLGFMLTLGFLVATIRAGATLDLERRTARRWFSILGMRFGPQIRIEDSCSVSLERAYTRAGKASLLEESSAILCTPERSWTFLSGASAKDAAEIAGILGLAKFRMKTYDRTRGRAERQRTDYAPDSAVRVEED